MKTRALFFFIFILINSGVLSKLSSANCLPNQRTHLNSNSCANVWSPNSAKFPWLDLYDSCVRKTAACEPLKEVSLRTMNVSECKEVEIKEVFLEERLALIHCMNSPTQSGDLLINEDRLACHSKDATQYQGTVKSTTPHSPTTGESLLAEAETKIQEVQAKVTKDSRLLLDLTLQTEPTDFYEWMKGAKESIGDLFLNVCQKQDLNFICEPIDGRKLITPKEIRAQATCRLLQNTYKNAIRVFNSASRFSSAELGSDQKYRESRALQEMVRTADPMSDRYDPVTALSIRMLTLYALKDHQRDLPDQLQLIRKSWETSAVDPSTPNQSFFWELHSGFVYGGHRLKEYSKGAYDCSDFISSLLIDREGSMQELSTLGLKNISLYLEGMLPAKALSQNLISLSSCFEPVHLHEGQDLLPGDLVVSNSIQFGNGHVVLVKKAFLNHTIATLEAANGTSNAITSKIRPLIEPKASCMSPEDTAPFRPDLYALRLKTPLPKECSLVIEPNKLNS